MRAIGWDHPRCMEPMLAAADAWHALTGVAQAWEFRPLADFNDQPLHELAPAYDLLVVDHPAVAEAVAHEALLPLEALLPEARVRRLAAEAVGPSGDSYRCGGATWAFAVDAACHVSARRPRLLDELGVPAPATWPAVLELARLAPGHVALPLLPADALCALLSIAATLGRPVAIDGEIAVEAVALLAELAPLLHPDSWTCAPPQLLVRMAGGEPIAYMPLTFGYLGLAGGELRFGDAPAAPDGRRAPILGGAGLAVSAASPEPALAAAFAAWICETEAQRSVVLARGGQPAHGTVWASPGRDAIATAFFHDTGSSMEHAYVRPSHPAWPAFHRDAGADLAAALRAGEPAPRIARRLQERLDAVRAAA
jgi:multiple sugar transport system substrate-binding protein